MSENMVLRFTAVWDLGAFSHSTFLIDKFNMISNTSRVDYFLVVGFSLFYYEIYMNEYIII